jgi:UDP-glucose 4-epimerase
MFRVLDITPARYPWSLDALYTDVTLPLYYISGHMLVHLASETNVRYSIAHPRRSISRNCLGMLNCLDQLRSENFKHLIFTSSASSDLSESPYLASKRACEALCQAYKSSYGVNIKILKLSSVYGPHSIKKNSVIPSFIKRCINREPIVIYGDGSQVRDFINVKDVVKSITHQKEGFITTGKLTTISRIAEIISSVSNELIDFTPEIRYEQFINGEVRRPLEVKSDLSTFVDIESGIYETFQWFKRNYASQQMV